MSGEAQAGAEPAAQGRTGQPAGGNCFNCGVVETVRAMDVPDATAAGSQAAKAGGRTAFGVLGAVSGAYGGNSGERQGRSPTRYRVMVRMDDGTRRAVYMAERPDFDAGDKVRVVNGGLAAPG
jgi:outer membrane lipoprotein SlyB